MDEFDLINGCFELFGTFAIGLNVFKLHREKIVRGVHWMSVFFFLSWGSFNIAYYPHLEQWFSFMGALCLLSMQAVYLSQLFYYNHKEKVGV